LPAQIDRVLDVTGQQKLTYVGHSQGNTQMFYALATNEEELKNKINLFVALAPITRITGIYNTSFKGNWLMDHARYAVEDLIATFGYYQFGGVEAYDKTICEHFPDDCWYINLFKSSFTEYDDPQRLAINSNKQQPWSWKESAHYTSIS
jgi:pimeloyl-ACP methyl ester carboxylesterase